MVNALIKLNDNTNRVINMVKAKFGFNDKSQAVEFIVNKYIEAEDEPELRPEFIKEMKKIEKQKGVRVNDFAKRYGLK
jgi:hypothetical protein